VWFIQQDHEEHAVAWDAEVDALPTGTLALTRWMNEVRFYAENHWVSMPVRQAPVAEARVMAR